jgi:hypothetical protein
LESFKLVTCQHLVPHLLPKFHHPHHHPQPSSVIPLYPEAADEDVVVEEWTEPVDVSKLLFFWNINGIVLTPSTPLPQMQKVVRWVLGGHWIAFQPVDFQGVLGVG